MQHMTSRNPQPRKTQTSLCVSIELAAKAWATERVVALQKKGAAKSHIAHTGMAVGIELLYHRQRPYDPVLRDCRLRNRARNMPITPFLNREKFDPETTRVMG